MINICRALVHLPLQLRYLQTLNSISAENNSTIVFPVPIDIMSQLMNTGTATGSRQSTSINMMDSMRKTGNAKTSSTQTTSINMMEQLKNKSNVIIGPKQTTGVNIMDQNMVSNKEF